MSSSYSSSLLHNIISKPQLKNTLQKHDIYNTIMKSESQKTNERKSNKILIPITYDNFIN